MFSLSRFREKPATGRRSALKPAAEGPGRACGGPGAPPGPGRSRCGDSRESRSGPGREGAASLVSPHHPPLTELRTARGPGLLSVLLSPGIGHRRTRSPTALALRLHAAARSLCATRGVCDLLLHGAPTLKFKPPLRCGFSPLKDSKDAKILSLIGSSSASAQW